MSKRHGRRDRRHHLVPSVNIDPFARGRDDRPIDVVVDGLIENWIDLKEDIKTCQVEVQGSPRCHAPIQAGFIRICREGHWDWHALCAAHEAETTAMMATQLRLMNCTKDDCDSDVAGALVSEDATGVGSMFTLLGFPDGP